MWVHEAGNLVQILLTPEEAATLRMELVSQETATPIKKALWEGLMRIKGRGLKAPPADEA